MRSARNSVRDLSAKPARCISSGAASTWRRRRFSGRRAPERPGADAMTREAYSHEVSSVGWWPGNGGFDAPMFYAYAAPEPAGFRESKVRPAQAYYDAQDRRIPAALRRRAKLRRSRGRGDGIFSEHVRSRCKPWKMGPRGAGKTNLASCWTKSLIAQSGRSSRSLTPSAQGAGWVRDDRWRSCSKLLSLSARRDGSLPIVGTERVPL